MRRNRKLRAVIVVGLAPLGWPALADEPAASGSPTATQTIPGAGLPPPAPFGGVVNLNAAHSKPWWPARVVPPKGAPNVLLTGIPRMAPLGDRLCFVMPHPASPGRLDGVSDTAKTPVLA